MDSSCLHVHYFVLPQHGTGRFIGGYGELEGEDNCHADGDGNNKLDDLFGSMFESSLQ